MRITLFTWLLLWFSITPVLATEPDNNAAPPPATTRIEVDEENNIIRFFINGEQKAVLDAEGLHVREGIRYGRDIIDYGQSGFDKQISEAADAP